MSFYNPYMKTPDWSQGIGDIASQIQMMLMLKKLMPQQQGQQQGPPMTPMPQNRMGGGGGLPGLSPGNAVMGAAPQQMNDQPYSQGGGQNPLSNMDPKMLMMIMQMIQQMKGGQMGNGGMMGNGMGQMG